MFEKIIKIIMAEQIPEQETSQSANSAPAGNEEEQNSNGLLTSIINEIIYSPLNLVLVALIAFIIYKIIKSRNDTSQIGGNAGPPEPKLPKLRKDFTVHELRKFDGNQPDGRVLVAVNGTVYDVTKGKRFYGPGKFCLLHFTYNFFFFYYNSSCFLRL